MTDNVASETPEGTPEEPTQQPDEPAVEADAVAAAPAVEKAAKPPPPPARDLPDDEAVAAWIRGEEVGTIGTLFEGLPLKRYDSLVSQIRKKDLLPQHWQVISAHGHPDDAEFEALPEIRRLRTRYGDAELGQARADALLVGWRELRGKRPMMWTVPDLWAAMRRIIDKGLDVDYHHLLAGTRDIWSDMSLPQGKEQLTMLWHNLALVRTKIKK